MTRPEEPTEALPTRAMPPVTEPGTTVDLDSTMAVGGSEPTVHLAAADATVHLTAPDQAAHLGSSDATVHLGAPDQTVHLGGHDRTVPLAVPHQTVHLGATDRTPTSGPTVPRANPGATDRTVSFGSADAATTHFGAPTGPPTTPFGVPAGRIPAVTGPITSGYGATTGAYPEQSAPAGEVRFGPGVPATPPGAPAWPAPAPARPRRPVWRRAVSVLSTLLTLALVAVVGLYLWERLSPVEVEGVTVAVPRPAGDRCDVTVDVVATVRTNGRGGIIRYQWFRSDAPPGALLTERVGRGQRTATLTLKWTFSGVGATTETATVNIIEPSPVQAGTQVTYRCRRG
ncbi:hypothetical protein [Micromonospora sp. NPDC003776]